MLIVDIWTIIITFGAIEAESNFRLICHATNKAWFISYFRKKQFIPLEDDFEGNMEEVTKKTQKRMLFISNGSLGGMNPANLFKNWIRQPKCEEILKSSRKYALDALVRTLIKVGKAEFFEYLASFMRNSHSNILSMAFINNAFQPALTSGNADLFQSILPVCASYHNNGKMPIMSDDLENIIRMDRPGLLRILARWCGYPRVLPHSTWDLLYNLDSPFKEEFLEHFWRMYPHHRR